MRTAAISVLLIFFAYTVWAMFYMMNVDEPTWAFIMGACSVVNIVNIARIIAS